MNLLDSFYYMFTADTSAVTKGVKQAEDESKKLKSSLDSADLSAEKLGESFVKMARAGATALGSVLALGAIKSLVNDTNAQTAAVALQARAINMNVEQLNAYQHAVMIMGGTAEGATQTLTGLRDKFVEMARFGAMLGPDAFMFRQLGLSAQQMHDSIKDPTIALGALAEKFKTLDKTQQLYIGKKLGLDQGTIALLAQGGEAFADMIRKQKELGVVTEAQAQASLKYKIAQTELGITFDTVKREIVTQLLPAFTWVLNSIDKAIQYLRDHKGLAIGFFGTLAAVIGTTLLPVLISSAAAMWALIAPILLAAAPFIALGAAVALVVDDFEKFKAGQNSVIGEILKRWPAAGELFKAVLSDIGAALSLLNSLIKGTFDYFIALSAFLVDVITKGPSKALDILNGKTAAIFENIGKHFSKLVGAVKGVGAAGSNLWDELTGKGKKETDVNAGIMPPTLTATGRELMQKLVASGKWTPEQAAGIAGSFMQESGGNADALNKSSGAYGLGQWLGTRVKDFEKWAGKSLKGSSLDDQIAFFNYETEHSEKRAGDMIRRASTASEAAYAHSKYYERPGALEANNARREQLANSILSGQRQVGATNTPLAAISSQSIANSMSRTSTTAISFGPTNISTAATDPKAVAEEHERMLRRQISNAVDYHDDGVLT